MKHTVFIQRRFAKHFPRVADELLAEFLSQFVRFALRRIAVIDIVLEELQHIRVSTIEKADTASGNFTIDSGETTKDDVVVHEKSVLAGPVPGRVEAPGLEGIKSGLNPVD